MRFAFAAGTFQFATLCNGRCIRIPTAPLLTALGFEVAGSGSHGGQV